ncbi:unnamed protein product [Vitrella brassicaformis CCMP3155]|uniref:F-box domain-containing protein n=2 Tax=Vitrella brassicaformis TaxID=1169539 RepID=A0A0G4F4G7_VITBC|nr:unnamed protein product [Vitrella brassicaformis CCMP3155]|eukprot:CEM06941.1 unnamed protein product [Vitrella brassicaformis CCMP3155]
MGNRCSKRGSLGQMGTPPSVHEGAAAADRAADLDAIPTGVVMSILDFISSPDQEVLKAALVCQAWEEASRNYHTLHIMGLNQLHRLLTMPSQPHRRFVKRTSLPLKTTNPIPTTSPTNTPADDPDLHQQQQQQGKEPEADSELPCSLPIALRSIDGPGRGFSRALAVRTLHIELGKEREGERGRGERERRLGRGAVRWSGSCPSPKDRVGGVCGGGGSLSRAEKMRECRGRLGRFIRHFHKLETLTLTSIPPALLPPSDFNRTLAKNAPTLSSVRLQLLGDPVRPSHPFPMLLARPAPPPYTVPAREFPHLTHLSLAHETAASSMACTTDDDDNDSESKVVAVRRRRQRKRLRREGLLERSESLTSGSDEDTSSEEDDDEQPTSSSAASAASAASASSVSTRPTLTPTPRSPPSPTSPTARGNGAFAFSSGARLRSLRVLDLVCRSSCRHCCGGAEHLLADARHLEEIFLFSPAELHALECQRFLERSRLSLRRVCLCCSLVNDAPASPADPHAVGVSVTQAAPPSPPSAPHSAPASPPSSLAAAAAAEENDDDTPTAATTNRRERRVTFAPLPTGSGGGSSPSSLIGGSTRLTRVRVYRKAIPVFPACDFPKLEELGWAANSTFPPFYAFHPAFKCANLSDLRLCVNLPWDVVLEGGQVEGLAPLYAQALLCLAPRLRATIDTHFAFLRHLTKLTTLAVGGDFSYVEGYQQWVGHVLHNLPAFFSVQEIILAPVRRPMLESLIETARQLQEQRARDRAARRASMAALATPPSAATTTSTTAPTSGSGACVRHHHHHHHGAKGRERERDQHVDGPALQTLLASNGWRESDGFTQEISTQLGRQVMEVFPNLRSVNLHVSSFDAIFPIDATSEVNLKAVERMLTRQGFRRWRGHKDRAWKKDTVSPGGKGSKRDGMPGGSMGACLGSIFQHIVTGVCAGTPRA